MISIVVPVYNIEQYLQRCFDSFQRQTIQDIEIICVDDGSVDNSAQILDGLAEKYPNLIVIHQKNAGVTTARLIGIQVANGDNIGFCDGDDEVEPDMFELLLENKEKYGAEISHCGHKIIYPDGREKYFYNTGRLAVQDKTEGLINLLSGSFEPGLCSKLYSKSLLHSLLHSGVVNSDIKINEDLLMNYYLFKAARKTVYQDVCLYRYMKREGSASTSKSIRFFKDPVRVREIILQDIDEDDTQLRKAAIVSFIRINISMYMHGIMRDSGLSRAEVEQFRTNIKNNLSQARYLDFGGLVHAYLIAYAPRLCNAIFNNY